MKFRMINLRRIELFIDWLQSLIPGSSMILVIMKTLYNICFYYNDIIDEYFLRNDKIEYNNFLHYKNDFSLKFFKFIVSYSRDIGEKHNIKDQIPVKIYLKIVKMFTLINKD